MSEPTVEAVLAGEASYDDLSDHDQAVARAAWEARIDVALDGLDLRTGFEVEGRGWVEADAEGNPVTRQP